MWCCCWCAYEGEDWRNAADGGNLKSDVGEEGDGVISEEMMAEASSLNEVARRSDALELTLTGTFPLGLRLMDDDDDDGGGEAGDTRSERIGEDASVATARACFALMPFLSFDETDDEDVLGEACGSGWAGGRSVGRAGVERRKSGRRSRSVGSSERRRWWCGCWRWRCGELARRGDRWADDVICGGRW